MNRGQQWRRKQRKKTLKDSQSCFWCDRPFDKSLKKTLDHLLSAPLVDLLLAAFRLDYGGLSQRQRWTVPACKDCNDARGKISNFLKLLRANREPTFHFWRSRAELLPQIHFFYEQISAKLEGQQAEWCLKELQELL